MFSWTNLTFLKPLIPRILQIKFRRALAKKAYLSARGTWPIDPKSSKPPDGWKGWPDNKKFALVITHDVDTAEGHDQCMQLAEMEKRHGFRSSFNFVAEDYKISDRLINDLRSDGFEIGSHSIRHKNPFKSPDKFPALASQINHYLKEWDAVGFRSPSMYHNMDLLHHLNIEYDASTFDTDPFEPQPDGIGERLEHRCHLRCRRHTQRLGHQWCRVTELRRARVRHASILTDIESPCKRAPGDARLVETDE